MTKRISKTTEAIGQLHQAHRKRAHAEVLQRESRDPFDAALERIDATKLEAAAAEVLKMPELAPRPPTGGEVGMYAYPDPADLYTGMHLRDTLRTPNMVEAQASLERYKLLMEIGCVELDQDLAATIQPTNSLERMLAGQLASTHYLALRFLALSQTRASEAAKIGQPYWREHNVEACRLMNAATRLLSSFNEGAATLHKLRTGGKQTVVVQHVHVSEGGQAVIAGDMTTGGGGLSAPGGLAENEGTMPCTQTTSRPGTSTCKAPGEPPVVAPTPAKRRRARAPRFEANGAVACMEDTSPAAPGATSTP